MRSFGAACLAALVFASTAVAETRYSIVDWTDLKGWERDEHQTALDVFLETCPDMDDADWASLCAVAQQQESAKAFFEIFFLPVMVEDGEPALFTGYFEPELRGSKVPTSRYQYPLYKKPPELEQGSVWYSRAEIESLELLSGRNLEIAWIDDPVDVFFLQVQGSGRVEFTDGDKLRVGYGGKNGHEYKSVGQELVRRGIFQPHQVSAQVIRNWVKENPSAGRELLHHNPSYVFFREVSRVPAERGPLGAMNRSITKLRTVAVDPEFVPLGAPIWLEKAGASPLNRLMVAQDTGSAIKGAQRADIFYGTGSVAGSNAGRIKDPGRMLVLMPIERALRLAGEG